MAEVNERLDRIDAVVDWAQENRPGHAGNGSTKTDYEEYVAELLDRRLGPIKDLTREARELRQTAGEYPDPPSEPEEPPEPPWVPNLGDLDHAMTAPTHHDGTDLAIDVYTQKGEGALIAMPIGGNVVIQTAQTPGGILYAALFQADNGWTYLFSHINEYQYRTGRVEAYEPFALQGVSGLRNMLQYKPSHIHFGVVRGHVMMDADGLGDVNALAAWNGLGISIEEMVSRIPGPSDYLSGRWYAGRYRG